MEKYVYIKKSISLNGHYVDFAEPLSAQEYNNLGETWQDYINNKWILLSDEQVTFHEENPSASIKEVFDMKLDTPYERTLDDAKHEKLEQIREYDSSDNVNAVLINGTKAWLTPEERANYKNSIDAAKLLNIENVSFYINNTEFTATVTNAELMLAQIQLYADACFIATKQHEAAINNLDTVEAIDAYDYTVGYPDMLIFMLE